MIGPVFKKALICRKFIQSRESKHSSLFTQKIKMTHKRSTSLILALGNHG